MSSRKIQPPSATAKVSRSNNYTRNNAYINNSSPRPRESRRVSSRKIQPPSATAQVSRNNNYTRNNASALIAPSHPRESHRVSSKRVTVNSATAKVSRNNVYSSHNQFVNNPHRVPKVKTQAFSNRRTLNRVARMSTKPEPPGRKRVISIRSTSRPYVTWGRKNVYWGKFKVVEKPVVTDITGRPLRAKNYHTPPLEAEPRKDVYRNRKSKGGDQPFKGTFGSGFRTTPKVTKAWKGDVSGHAIRTQPPKFNESAGQMIGTRPPTASRRADKPQRPLRIVGLVRKSQSGKISNQPVTRKAPGIGAILIDRSLGKYRGGKKPKLFGSRKGGFNNNGQPITGQQPGIGGRFVGTYQGFEKGNKPVKGGGSISGKLFNNNGQPIEVKGPGIGGRFADIYSGNIKTSRPAKGGGSISGKLWNNANQPIIGKIPAGLQARYVDIYQGFHKARKPFNRDGYNYSGNKRIWIEPKGGGGSISGKLWNNRNQPIQGKVPAGSIQAKYVDIYQGYYKGHKPIKGGGSVSGKLWNNKEQAIIGKTYSPASLSVSVYPGNIKASKPVKGGGSISGKLWNNKEQPIQGKTYDLSQMKVSSYPGDIKLKRLNKYIQNPKANEIALKKAKPNKTTYLVDGLQVKTKAHDYALNKHSSKSAMKGESEGKNSLKAIEYANRMKVLWVKTFGNEKDLAGRNLRGKYVHAPNSKKGALMVLAPGKATARVKDLQVNVKMSKPHGHNLHPDSKFANSYRDNVKHERTLFMNIKLTWAKLFKKNANQPKAVKEKIRRPRYDKNEKEVWKDLYD